MNVFHMRMRKQNTIKMFPIFDNLFNNKSRSIVSNARFRSRKTHKIFLPLSISYFQSCITKFSAVSHEWFFRNPDWTILTNGPSIFQSSAVPARRLTHLRKYTSFLSMSLWISQQLAQIALFISSIYNIWI